MNFGAHHSNYPQYSVGADPSYRKHDPAATVATPLNHDETPAVSYIRPASPSKPYTTWAEQYNFPPSTNFQYQFDPAWHASFATEGQHPLLTTAPIMHPTSIPTPTHVSTPIKFEPTQHALPPSPPSALPQAHSLENRQQTPLALIRVPKEGAGRHLEIQFVCHSNNCGRVFKRAEHLRRHIRCVHSLDRPYACPVKDCGKRFSRSDNLNQHVKTHKSYFMEQQQQPPTQHPNIIPHPPNHQQQFHQPFNFNPSTK